MVSGTGKKLRLQHVVDDERMQLLITSRIIAIQLVTGRCGPAIGVHLIQLHLGVEIAQVLSRSKHVVESMLELITERLLITFVAIYSRFTFEEVARDALAITLMQCAV